MKRTGFTDKQIAAIRARDANRSAWSGNESDTLVPQHRANRGMGGRESMNRLSNGVLIESEINGLIESDPHWQAEAQRRGIKVSAFSNPATVPITHAVHGVVRLDDEGGVHK